MKLYPAHRGYECEECGAAGVDTVVLAQGDGVDARWFCAACLQRALALLGTDVATLTRERDEARAALAVAHTRALQAAADVVLAAESRLFDGADECDVVDFLVDIANEITDLTPDDIDRIAKEHEHG